MLMLIKSLLQDWFQLHAPGIKPRTQESYQHLLSKYILPAIGETEAEELTPLHIRHMLADIVASGHTRTAELVFVLCKCAFGELDLESPAFYPELIAYRNELRQEVMNLH